MTAAAALSQTAIPGLSLLRRGKVRDVYDLGSELLIISTDRLSAFDHILPTPIPGKGEILNHISAHWFETTRDIAPNHMITCDLTAMTSHLPDNVSLDAAIFGKRTLLARKAKRVDAECVVRGYLAGSGWKEYIKTGTVGGHQLPAGLKEASALPEPIFTPATKADEGHDENITRAQLADLVGADTAAAVEKLSLALYRHAAERLYKRGLILADTKFEFGFIDGRLSVIDEMITPDSSRVWRLSSHQPGRAPDNFDKQYVRDYLESTGWDKTSAPPPLPNEVVAGTLRRYREFLEAAA